MTDTDTGTDHAPSRSAVDARRREMAIEHVLFQTVRWVERQHPGLLDAIEGSLDHLGDYAHDGTKDDEAVREIARKLVNSARAEGAKKGG